MSAEIASFTTGGRLAFVVRGELTAAPCEELCQRILASDADEVVIDVTAATIENLALNVLANLIRDSGRSVDIRGLRARQIRLLEWLSGE